MNGKNPLVENQKKWRSLLD